MHIRRIETLKEFEDLAPLWSELATASGQTSPFMTHDWFWCCWQAVWPERRPEVLVLEDGSDPVAMIPLMRWKGRYRHLPVRCLGLLVCPDSPWVEPLIVGDPAPILDAFLDYLAARSDWDVLFLQKLPKISGMRKTLEDLLPGRLLWRQAWTHRSPYLTIAETWETFFRSKTQRFRKTCRNIQNRLERAGEVRVEVHRAVDPAGPLFCEVIEITRRSRKAQHGLTIATMPRMPEFFHQLTLRAARNGWLSLWILRLNSRAIAMEYQLETAGKVHALRADYDPVHAELSPGSALNAAIVRSLFEHGKYHEYDMGPGDDEYKLRWATGSHEAVDLEVFSPSAYGRLLHGIETRLVPWAREWRDRMMLEPFEQSNARIRLWRKLSNSLRKEACA
jgi:CelD/BcsL family acetyltransferase involved in cellulose biosynthesis